MGRTYGLPLAPVREVVTARPFTALPGSPEPVCGLINLRGRMITVVDLGSLLGEAPTTARPDHRIVVLEHHGRSVGLAVEDVLRTVRPEPAAAGPEEPREDPAVGAAAAEAQEEESPVRLDLEQLLRPLFA